MTSTHDRAATMYCFEGAAWLSKKCLLDLDERFRVVPCVGLVEENKKFALRFPSISFRYSSVSMAMPVISVGTLVSNVMKVNREQKKGSEGMPFVRPSFPLIDRDSVAI